MTFDPTKPVRTRGGRSARIVCTDMNCVNGPIAAVVSNGDGTEYLSYYEKDGKYPGMGRGGEELDLVNYDPYEITDEEAELIIALVKHIKKTFPRSVFGMDDLEKVVRARKWFPRGSLSTEFRDIIIKHRKK